MRALDAHCVPRWGPNGTEWDRMGPWLLGLARDELAPRARPGTHQLVTSGLRPASGTGARGTGPKAPRPSGSGNAEPWSCPAGQARPEVLELAPWTWRLRWRRGAGRCTGKANELILSPLPRARRVLTRTAATASPASAPARGRLGLARLGSGSCRGGPVGFFRIGQWRKVNPMPLPTSRNQTFTDLEPILPETMNDIQDGIIALHLRGAHAAFTLDVLPSWFAIDPARASLTFSDGAGQRISFSSSSAGLSQATLGVSLPKGSRILEVKVWASKNGNAMPFTASLKARRFDDGTQVPLATATDETSLTARKAIVLTLPTQPGYLEPGYIIPATHSVELLLLQSWSGAPLPEVYVYGAEVTYDRP